MATVWTHSAVAWQVRLNVLQGAAATGACEEHLIAQLEAFLTW